MKVLHVFKTYLPDSVTGIERVIWEIAEGSVTRGIEPHVLTLSTKPAATPLNVGRHTVHQAKLDLYIASTGLSLSALPAFRRLAAGADIIHYHFPWPMMDALHLLVRPGKPSVVTYHSDIVRQKTLMRLYEPVMHRFLRSVDCVVATSPNYAASSLVLRQYAAKTTTIPIGISERVPPSPAIVTKWRERVGEGFFLFVGALRYYKGLSFLLSAARATRLPLVIAGTGEAAAEIASANLPNIAAVGQVDDADKEALLELCRAFVFPSHLRSEAFGVSLLEAARAGKPMISCEIGTGTSYVNVDGETGLIIPPADERPLARAMETLMSNPNEARRMGANARARYERLFTADEMADAYADLYRRLVERGTDHADHP